LSRISRGTPAGDAYLDLKNQAQRTGRATQELLQLYVLEGFLARLAVSNVRTNFVLKGGVLLAAFGTRRATKDIDLAGRDLDNSTEAVLDLVRAVLRVSMTDDGLEFSPDSATADVIRDQDQYSGVRVHVEAQLASARLSFHVDVNVGDPIWPAPTTVEVPRLRGGDAIRVSGYPIHMVHAEKIVTAVERGIANTRWRDFGDIYTLARRHAIDGSDLQRAIQEVAEAREATLAPLTDILDGYAALAQSRWVAWRRRSGSDHLPIDFAEVLDAVLRFAERPLSAKVQNLAWDPVLFTWR
jgi:nucleotidyltransferase AbiEii toxin of type IV toxin-antitoxin system